MDAVEFFKERIRMCNSFEGCVCCPLEPDCTDTDPKLMVKAVEDWSQSHPQKTMMQDFFEKFPNAPKTILGFPYPCAKDLGYPRLDSCSFGLKNTPGAFCKECWSRPLED